MRMEPYSKQIGYIPRVKTKYNPYDEAPNARLNWLPNDIEVVKKADLGLYIGCTQSYRQQRYVILITKLLQKLGIKFTLE
ncbi:MAG: hypothetical protein QXP55_04810 [Nitrososphaerales archaeon]